MLLFSHDPPISGVLFLKQGDSAGCHCYSFPGLRILVLIVNQMLPMTSLN